MQLKLPKMWCENSSFSCLSVASLQRCLYSVLPEVLYMSSSPLWMSKLLMRNDTLFRLNRRWIDIECLLSRQLLTHSLFSTKYSHKQRSFAKHITEEIELDFRNINTIKIVWIHRKSVTFRMQENDIKFIDNIYLYLTFSNFNIIAIRNVSNFYLYKG